MMQRQVDTITKTISRALEKPQVRRRVKWSAVIVLVINILAWSFGPYFLSKPNQTEAASLIYVGGNTGTGTGATYSVSLTALTGGASSAAATGDIVIVVTGWASTANGDPGISSPTGYTEYGGTDLWGNDTRDANVSLNWKIMGATPDTSVTVRGFNNAANGGSTSVHVWRNVNSSNPVQLAATSPTGINSANANSPSITPDTAGSVIISAGVGTGDATPTAKTGPAGMINWRTANGVGTTMSAISGIASYAWTSGAYDPAAWTGGETTTSDSWGAYSIALRPSNDPPTLNIDAPASDIDVAESENYTIQYDLSDTEDAATVDFYYDPDGAGGTAPTVISACQNQPEGTDATCQFVPSVEGMANGTYYYIYGVASDGVNPDVTDYSIGRVRPNDAPTLSITDPDGTGDTVTQGQTYTIYFSLADTDSTVTVDLYYDLDGSGLDGTAIVACQNLSEATTSCGWDTTGVTPDTYFIYGRDVNDGINAEVTAYSPGEVTITSSNQNPNDPTSLTQKTSPGGVTITESGWTNDSTPTFTFTITDNDSDTVKYAIDIDDEYPFSSPFLVEYTHGSYSPSGTTFSFTVGDYSGGSCVVIPGPGTCPNSLPDNGTGYWWRVRAIDDKGAESSYVDFGTGPVMDFKVDATAPTGAVIYDGDDGSQHDYNDYVGGSLNSLSAYWVSSAPNFDLSGQTATNTYQYAIGTTSGGTDIKNWTFTGNTGTDKFVDVTGLTLQTGQKYYFTVRAYDNVGNIGEFNSSGQQIYPVLSFSIGSNEIIFEDFDNANDWTDTKSTTLTTSTNAKNGYTIRGSINDYLRSLVYVTETIADFAGDWITPQDWVNFCHADITEEDCGFGYTSSDTSVDGSNRFNGGSLYAKYSQTPPGDILADNAGPTVDGNMDLINQIFTITHKVSVPKTQTATTYRTILTVICTANF